MISFKRGDTFKFAGTVSAVVGGVPTYDFSGWTVQAQLRAKPGGALIQQLDALWVNASTGAVTIEQSAASDAWPIGLAEMDLQFTAPSGDRTSTETVIFKIVDGVTRP